MGTIVHRVAGIALLAGAAWGGDPASSIRAETEPVLEGCLVSLIDEVKVPTREAGVIKRLAIRQGDLVKKGDILAEIDDDQPQMERRRAEAEHSQAVAKAASDVDVRYSEKAQDVAKATYEKAAQSDERVKGSVTEVERQRLRLEWEKTELQIEQAKLERHLTALAATSKQVELEAAEQAIERRRIRSPLDGEVEEVFPHEGEWLQPGEPLARIITIDRLYVDGFVDATRFGPAVLRGRPVTVEVSLDNGRVESLEGKIFKIKHRVEGGSYRVVAEVKNRQDRGEWILRAGQIVRMTIHSGQPPVVAAEH
jgi:macrolide-specific efflux system membrane fusion protein